VYLYVLYDSHNKYQLFPKTTVTGWVLVIDTDCVLCEVRTEYWHVIWIYLSFEMANIGFTRRFYRSPFITIFTSRKHALHLLGSLHSIYWGHCTPFIGIIALHLLGSLNNMFYHVSNIYQWWQTTKLSNHPILTNNKHFLPERDEVWTPLLYSLGKPFIQMQGL